MKLNNKTLRVKFNLNVNTRSSFGNCYVITTKKLHYVTYVIRSQYQGHRYWKLQSSSPHSLYRKWKIYEFLP